MGHHLSAHHHAQDLAHLYLVIDFWSRKVVAWDVDEREDPAIASGLVNKACLKEPIRKGCKKPPSCMPLTATPRMLAP